MTKEEIKNTPEIVDFMLDKCVLADSREKVHKRLEEVCNMAIKALEQNPCNDTISRQAIDEIKELMTDINGDTVYAVRMSDIRQLPSVNPTSNVSIQITEREKYGRFN